MEPDFSIPRKDNPTISGTVSGFTSIAGFVITLSIKKGTNPNIPALFTKTAVIDNPTLGAIHFSLSSTDTDQPENIYDYDIKVVDTQGIIRHTKRSIMEITEAITP